MRFVPRLRVDQAGQMNRRRPPVQQPGSGFAGFRFSPEVFLIAVRWYLRY
jgi:hypothetical protein